MAKWGSFQLQRRHFLRASVAGGLVVPGRLGKATPETPLPSPGPVPEHLDGYEQLWELDPRAASRAWFHEARFGLFLHYGLYSLLGRGEWVQLRERIPVSTYERLKDRFEAENFDASQICDLALSAGMKYVNITTRHHDGFCLFETAETNFNSLKAPAGRDLVGELAEACRRKKLGLFFYYSYGVSWRHPYFFSRDAGWSNARPDYEEPQPEYLWEKDEDFQRYVEFCHRQLRELLTQYGPVAGIWFDPIMGYYSRPDLFPIEDTYALVRSLQPHCLISFKQGANGEEDFATPERDPVSLVEAVRSAFGPVSAQVAARAWERNRVKQLEFCDTLSEKSWGYDSREDGSHATADQVIAKLKRASRYRANLLLNTGPLADGSIWPGDQETLRKTGEWFRARRGGEL